MCRALLRRLRQTSKFNLDEVATDVNVLFRGYKLYLGIIWRNIACRRKHQCKGKYIYCFGDQNLGAQSGVLVWKFYWIIHYLDNNRPIVWETIDLSFSKYLMGVKGNSCYSIPSLGSPEAIVNQSWCNKIFAINHEFTELTNILYISVRVTCTI